MGAPLGSGCEPAGVAGREIHRTLPQAGYAGAAVAEAAARVAARRPGGRRTPRG